MFQQQRISFFTGLFVIPLLLIISACSSNGQITSDAKIQNDITIAVNDYNSENWEIRINAIKKISRYSNTVYAKNSLLLIFKALNDSHSEIRIEALKTLTKMKVPAAEKKISSIALLDENANVRFFAYSALGEYGNLHNEEIFLKGVQDQDWLVKEAALKGLMTIKDPEIQIKNLDIILKGIENKNISIRLTAISNLSIRHPLIYNELAKIINNRESNLFILKAALQKIKEYKLDVITKKRIIELLTSRDKSVRILSLQVLKQDELNLKL